MQNPRPRQRNQPRHAHINPFQCKDCGLKCGYGERLRKHQQLRGPLFARFKCACGASWVSAHAYCLNYQECQLCQQKAYPKQAQYKKRGSEDEQELKKPHKFNLCERCRSGLPCSAAAAANRKDEASALSALLKGMRIAPI